MLDTSIARGRPRRYADRDRPPPRYDSPLYLSPAQADRVRKAYRAAWQGLGSQRALSVALGCSQQSVSGVFSARVSLSMAALLSMHLGVLVGDLIGERRWTAYRVM